MLRASITDEQTQQISRQYRVGPPIYLVAVVIALFSPVLSLLVTLAVALYFAFPPRQVRVRRFSCGR